jgi:hypothetical protein
MLPFCITRDAIAGFTSFSRPRDCSTRLSLLLRKTFSFLISYSSKVVHTYSVERGWIGANEHTPCNLKTVFF